MKRSRTRGFPPVHIIISICDVMALRYNVTRLVQHHVHEKERTQSHKTSHTYSLEVLPSDVYLYLHVSIHLWSRMLTHVLQDTQLPPSNTSTVLPHKKRNTHSNVIAKLSTTSTTSGPSTPLRSIPPPSTPSPRRVLTGPRRFDTTRRRKGRWDEGGDWG